MEIFHFGETFGSEFQTFRLASSPVRQLDFLFVYFSRPQK